MVKNIGYVKKKWEDKMSNPELAKVWKKHTEEAVDTWAKHMAEFLGLPKISDYRFNNYKSGIERVTPEDFATAVKGKGERFAKRLLEAFKP